MRTVDHSAFQLRHPVLQLLDDTLDRGEGIGGRSLGPHDVAVTGPGHLADLALGDPGVLFLEEMDLGSLHSVEVPGDAGELLLDRCPQGFIELDVLGPDGDIHASSWFSNGPRAADLVFDPTLACRRGGRPTGGGEKSSPEYRQ